MPKETIHEVRPEKDKQEKPGWRPPERNWDGIDHEHVRRAVDPRFNELHDALSDAYYNYWSKGLSKPFHGYDVQATPEQSKALFDQLHGLIFHLRDIAFHRHNMSLPPQYRIPLGEYDAVRGADGTLIDSTVNIAKRAVKDLLAAGIDLREPAGLSDLVV